MKPEIKKRIELIQKGEVPEGYKETKVGIIPVDWDVTKLKNVLKIKHGKNQKEVESVDGKYPILGSGGIIGYSDEYLYNKPSVLIGRKGTINRPKYRTDAFWTVDTLFYSEIFDLHIPEFIYYKFCMINWRKYNESTGVPSLNASTIESIIISSPNNKFEQQTIAEILSIWDKAIELKEKFIEEKKEFKRGIMQKLLTGGGDVSSLWNKVQLKQGLIPTSYPINKPLESYDALGIRCHCKGTFVRFIEDPKKIGMDTLYRVKENELIVNITFAWEGAIALLSKKDEGKLVSHRFPTYKFNEKYAIPDYFKHLIKTKWFVYQLSLLSPGGAGRNRVLNKTDFLKLKVILPSILEQRKSANFLNCLDEEIDIFNKDLNCIKEQKRGLMQLLLTGIVRVNN